MTSLLRRSAPTALLLAGLVVVSGTSGAVAGQLVTGQDIKNGTITSVDLKNGSLTGADVKDGSLTGADVRNDSLTTADTSPQLEGDLRRVGGYAVVSDTEAVAAGDLAVLGVTCPAGTSILGTTAFWRNQYTAVQAEPYDDGSPGAGFSRSARTYAYNTTGQQDDLTLIAYCGRTSPS